MLEERRKSNRVVATFAATYKRKSGEIVDTKLGNISIDGCFVKTEQPIKMGEEIDLEITLPDNKLLNLSGRVMYQHPSDGFGVLFSSHGNIENSILSTLIDLLIAKPEMQSSKVQSPELEQYLTQNEAIS